MGRDGKLEARESATISCLSSSWASSRNCAHTSALLHDKIRSLNSDSKRKMSCMQSKNQEEFSENVKTKRQIILCFTKSSCKTVISERTIQCTYDMLVKNEEKDD